MEKLSNGEFHYHIWGSNGLTDTMWLPTYTKAIKYGYSIHSVFYGLIGIA